MSESGRSGWVPLMWVGLIVGALFIIPAVVGNLTSSSPEDWLRDHYDHVSGNDPDDDDGVVFRGTASARDTADEIEKGTNPSELDNAEGANQRIGSTVATAPETYYLRYDDDWLVVVEEQSSGSIITLYEFHTGYNHPSHHSHVSSWNSYSRIGDRGFSNSFRGGGSGFGK